VNPQEVAKNLAADNIFQDWRKQHPSAFLSHFFAALQPNLELKDAWELGYFDPQNEKMTVFVANNGFEIKPEDSVFSKDKPQVEELDLSKLHLDFQQAKNVYSENKQLFSTQQLGGGFVVLQVLAQQPVWNFTFISKSLQFCNLKIDAITGKLISHEIVNVVQRDP
jgi:hypothetical protein